MSIWNIGIKTAAAQNIVAINFINHQLGFDVSWGEWFLYAAPWSIVMSIALYFIMIKSDASRNQYNRRWQRFNKEELHKLGPVSVNGV